MGSPNILNAAWVSGVRPGLMCRGKMQCSKRRTQPSMKLRGPRQFFQPRINTMASAQAGLLEQSSSLSQRCTENKKTRILPWFLVDISGLGGTLVFLSTI